jgi:hypothetical protein
MDRTRNSMILFLVLPLIGSISAGCNSGTEEPAPPEPTTVAPADPSVGVDASEPTPIDPARFPDLAEGVLAEVPENFPADVPLYPGAIAAQGRAGNRDGVEMAAVQLLINDPPSQAFEFYERELASNGWSIEKAEDMGTNAAISVTKDDCKVTFLFAPSEDGGTDIFTVSECGDDT